MEPEPPRVWETGRGLTVRYGGRLLYSSVDPLRGVMQRLDSVVPKAVPPRTLVFVPSIGLGHGLAELVARTPPSSHVVCVETDQRLFAAACGLRPRLFPDHPRLTVVRGDDPAAVARMAHGLGMGRFRRVLIVPLSAAYDADRERYDRLADVLRDAVRVHWQNRMTLIRMGRLWVRNLIANLAALPRAADWTALRGDGPILVAGAGPSLERRLAWIAANRERLRVLAVDTALPVLADAGLAPDIVFALEAQWANLEDFLGASLDACSLVADLTATPSLLRRAPRLYLCASQFAPTALLTRLAAAGLSPAAIPPLGSVGVAALHLALRLTSGPVLAAGLDFAYSGGRTHARGAPAMRAALAASDRLAPADSAAASALLGRRLLRVADKRGEPTLSDVVLQGYAREAVRVAETAGAAGRVTDLDAGGLDKGGQPLAQGMPEGWPRLARRAPEPAPCWDRGAVALFVADERERLAAAASLVERLLAAPDGSAASGLDPRAESLLREVDYLSLDFPDAAPIPSADPRYLRRLARAARAAAVWWERGAAMIDRGE
jgi:hypothetical protein